MATLTDIIKQLQLKVSKLETEKSMAVDELNEFKETMTVKLEELDKKIDTLSFDTTELLSEANDDVETYLKTLQREKPELFNDKSKMIAHMEDYIKRTMKGLNWYSIYKTLVYNAKLFK